MTTTSYELAKSGNSESTLERGEGDERVCLHRRIVRGNWRRVRCDVLVSGVSLKLCSQFGVLVFQLPTRLRELRHTLGGAPPGYPGRDPHCQRGSRHDPRQDHGGYHTAAPMPDCRKTLLVIDWDEEIRDTLTSI